MKIKTIHDLNRKDSYLALFLVSWIIFAVCPLVVSFYNADSVYLNSIYLLLIIGFGLGFTFCALLNALSKIFNNLGLIVYFLAYSVIFYLSIKMFVFPNKTGDIENFHNIFIYNNPLFEILYIVSAILITAYKNRISIFVRAWMIVLLILPIPLLGVQLYNLQKKDIPKLDVLNIPEGSSFIFITDMASGPLFYDLIENDSINSESFKDFTFFLNTTTPGIGTKIALPRIFSGSNIEAEDINELEERGIKENAFQHFSNVESHIVLRHGLTSKYCEKDQDIYCHEYVNLKEESLKLFRISLARVIPPSVSIIQGVSKVIDRVHYHFANQDHKKNAYFDDFSFIQFSDEGLPKIIVLYTMTTHSPYTHDVDCEFLEKEKFSEANKRKQSYVCVSKVFEKFLEKLKKENLYQSSNIVFMSDHGPIFKDIKNIPKSFSLISEGYHSFLKSNEPRVINLHGRFWPLLMMKRSGDMNAESNMPKLNTLNTDLIDVFPTLCENMQQSCSYSEWGGVNLFQDPSLFKNRLRVVQNVKDVRAAGVCHPEIDCFNSSQDNVYFEPEFMNFR